MNVVSYASAFQVPGETRMLCVVTWGEPPLLPGERITAIHTVCGHNKASRENPTGRALQVLMQRPGCQKHSDTCTHTQWPVATEARCPPTRTYLVSPESHTPYQLYLGKCIFLNT